MMKTKLALLLAGALALLITGCKPDEPEGNGGATGKAGIAGQWVLSAFTTKSVDVAGTKVDVYLDFVSDGSFTIYQQIGQGWYSKFTGTWDYDGVVLSGTYSDGKQWGSLYNVSVTAETLVLTTVSGKEEYTYKSTTIPENVKNGVH